MSEYTDSELPAIELFQRMGYTYLNASEIAERNDITEVLLQERLRAAIKRINPWISDNNLNKAFNEFTSVSGNSLMEINQQIWEFIRGGTYSVKQVFEGKESFRAVHFIDYNNVDNNDFLLVNQMKFHGRLRNSIPDLLIFVNGMPLAVIEAKSPIVKTAWDTAFSDLKYYQENSPKLFYYNQICAGIWGVGARYGAINADQQFYSVFKSSDKDSLPDYIRSEQDKLIYNLFAKEQFLDIIRHFVLYELDEGRIIKKLPRYQQIRATNKTIAKLQDGEGGVVWHTQGSGKSLTMAYITRKLQAEEYGFENPTVLIMTDRKDLDRQITNTFRNVGFKSVQQATSVMHLDNLLRNDYGGIITTTLQKFQETDKESSNETDQTELEEKSNLMIEKQIKDKLLIKITKELRDGRWQEIAREEIALDELSKKENLYVMVDEAHRSHYGFLASFMRTVLPKAKFIAFTGTPISKEDKSTLAEFYGGKYIDVYTIKESVADGATVKLLYDEGIARIDVRKEELDQEFELQFGDYSAEKKDRLKSEALRKYQNSSKRIREICKHMVAHYASKIRPDGHKAMIVCRGRANAIQYKRILEDLRNEGVHDFDSKVVISIGSPKSDDIARQYYEDLEWNRNNPNDKRPILVVAPEDIKAATEDYKLPFGNEKDKAKSGKKKYDNTAFIIVSDMLLTGWDAPIASCLYLDKPLKEHNLLQAIARVNRSRKGKNAGYIMDYNGITAYLIQALEIFSGDLQAGDILRNLAEEIPTLELNHTKLVDFFKPMKIDRNYERDAFIDAALLFIEPIDKRDEFKDLLKHFNRSINMVLPNPKALIFQGDFKLYNEIKLRARNAFPDDDDLRVNKDESEMLQQMIDEHLEAEGITSLLNEPISIIDKDKFKEEIQNASPKTKELKMRNNLKHVIKVGLEKNPDFYKPLAQRLEELIKQKEEERIEQVELFKAFADIQDEIISEKTESNKHGFNTESQRAVYSSMKTLFDNNAVDATKTIFDLIDGELDIINWTEKGQVLKEIENKIGRYLKSAKIERKEARAKSKELVELLKVNHNA
jgi:type I restriction enzyme R subunit